MLLLCGNSVQADDPVPALGILTLVNGDAVAGQLRPAESSDLIQWQNDEFLDPFAFRIDAIESVRFPDRPKYRPDETFVVECVDGDVLTGDIVDWNADHVELQSKTLGTLSIHANAIRHIHRAKSGTDTSVNFSTGLSDWNAPGWTTEQWIDQGEHLASSQAGATLNGEFQIPERAVVDFELAWEGRPDFVFSIAVDPAAQSDSDTDGWRLETVGDQLTVIREEALSADVDVVRDLSKRTKIRLLAFLDQNEGEMRLFLPSGEEIAKITGRAKKTIRGGIRLINRTGTVKLNRLRITKWTGQPPWIERTDPIQINFVNNRSVSGSFQSFDADSRTLTIVKDKNTFTAKLQDLSAVHFRGDQRLANQSGSVFRLSGGSQLSGKITGVSETDWIVRGDKFLDDARVPQAQVHHITITTKIDEDPKRWDVKLGSEIDGHRIGRIELGASDHFGWIADSSEDREGLISGTSAITWRPLASKTACRLKPNVSGRIVYEAGHISTKFGRPGALNRTTRKLRPSGDKSFGKLFLESVDRVESRRARRDQHVVHLTSGDVIACRVETIGEQGVYLSTVAQEDVLVGHDDIKAVELISNADLPALTEAKRDRLLTLPRLQKSSPPTHILCSSDGDLLRCRLIRASQETIDVEVQMEVISIARQRVSQIIWLHPQHKLSGDTIDQRYNGLVQVLWFDQKRMTFQPTETTDESIRGTSKILGNCDVDLGKVTQIVLGTRIASESTKLRYSDWKLSDAVLPLIMQNGDGNESTVEPSQLVGQLAPRIHLERLDGGSFQLEDYQGRVVVLDFWASWCAPCMQSMPELHQAVGEFDQARVALIGINLEERREIVRAAVDRLGLPMVVALDIDGETTGAYQASAIPHTMVIAEDGKIASVIVGGGKSAIGKVREIIGELLELEP